MRYLDILNQSWNEYLKPREKNAPIVISLFAGCGGSSLGYSMAGFKELLAVEWNDNAVETFKLNFPGIPVFHGDINELSVDQVKQMTGLSEGELDVLDGSPPCQGFSTAGKRILDDPRNNLFREYVRILRGLKPKMFIMENVSGLIKGKMKLVFAEIMRELKASGYRVKCKLLNAMWFNVPQSRQRLIWIGIRSDLNGEIEFPDHEKRVITCYQSLFNCEKSASVKISEKVIKRYEKTIAGNPLWAFGCGQVRLNKFKVAPAFTKCGASGYSMFHYDKARPLMISEMKRIGSFPDQFKFLSNYNDYKKCKDQIGNSVPPLFMKAIAESVKKMLVKESGEIPTSAVQ